MKAVALDNAGGRLLRIGWGSGRGRALAFAYAALADFGSAVGAGGAEPGGVGTAFRPLKAPPPASVVGFGSGAPAELVVPGAGGREDGLGCGWLARPAAGAPLCVAAALAPPWGAAPKAPLRPRTDCAPS